MISAVCIKCRFFRRDVCNKELAPETSQSCDFFLPAPTCPQCAEPWDACHCIAWQLKHFLYARIQVFWMLHFYSDPPWSDTGNTDGIGKQQNQSAPFEAVCCVRAEIEARIEACGEAGECLADEAPNVETINQLSRPARRALNYCSGWKRKSLSYRAWAKQIKYRNELLGLKAQ